MSAEDEWTCSKDGCELGVESHSLALAIEHIYGGTPSKDGRNFNREESKEVADRILDRLAGDLGIDR